MTVKVPLWYHIYISLPDQARKHQQRLVAALPVAIAECPLGRSPSCRLLPSRHQSCDLLMSSQRLCCSKRVRHPWYLARRHSARGGSKGSRPRWRSCLEWRKIRKTFLRLWCNTFKLFSLIIIDASFLIELADDNETTGRVAIDHAFLNKLYNLIG